ncbi:Hypothetical protein GOX1328 [Gluconobacter oxydans 621H]|uniref:Uncharacterized protein n=1 Tax=Gluconobacter oxydans (strain 621H) TaxID=290633 RepID=Q5FRB6_GLUOX|nr:Hypothetical protein GOX1328 [Gluconobacter oxydans 621H]
MSRAMRTSSSPSLALTVPDDLCRWAGKAEWVVRESRPAPCSSDPTGLRSSCRPAYHLCRLRNECEPRFRGLWTFPQSPLHRTMLQSSGQHHQHVRPTGSVETSSEQRTTEIFSSSSCS